VLATHSIRLFPLHFSSRASPCAIRFRFNSTARLKRDGTRAETRFGLSAKRTSPFKLAGGGGQFSRLLASEVCASAVVMVVMLDTPCSEVECKTTGYPLHSHVSPSLPLRCFTVCHQVSTELYNALTMLPAGDTSRQHRRCIVPQVVNTVQCS